MSCDYVLLSACDVVPDPPEDGREDGLLAGHEQLVVAHQVHQLIKIQMVTLQVYLLLRNVPLVLG